MAEDEASLGLRSWAGRREEAREGLVGVKPVKPVPGTLVSSSSEHLRGLARPLPTVRSLGVTVPTGEDSADIVHEY